MRNNSKLNITISIFCLIVFVSFLGCGNVQQFRMQNEVKDLEQQRNSLKKELVQFRVADKAIKNKKPYSVVSLNPRELLKVLKGAMPLKLNASTVNSNVKGTINILKLEDIHIKNNQVYLTMFAKGKNLKIDTYIPPGYKKQAKQILAGLHSGFTIKIRGKLSVNSDKGVYFDGRAVQVNLKKHGNKKNNKTIKNGINSSFFKKPHLVKTSKLKLNTKSLSIRAVFLIKSRIVLFFA